MDNWSTLVLDVNFSTIVDSYSLNSGLNSPDPQTYEWTATTSNFQQFNPTTVEYNCTTMRTVSNEETGPDNTI